MPPESPSLENSNHPWEPELVLPGSSHGEAPHPTLLDLRAESLHKIIGILKSADLEKYFDDIVKIHPSLDRQRLHESFHAGVNNIVNFDHPPIGNFYDHYLRPRLLTTAVTRLACGIPAFRRSNLGTLDSYNWNNFKNLNKENYIKSLFPFYRLFNKALAAAQVFRNGPGQSNRNELRQFLGPNAVQPSHLKDLILELRLELNANPANKPLERFAQLEELSHILAMSPLFGQSGPYMAIPMEDLSFEEILDLVEDQLNYTQFLMRRVNGKPVSSASSQIVDATREEYQKKLTRHLELNNGINILQSGPTQNGSIENARLQAEIASGRLNRAHERIQQLQKEIFGQRISWIALTESSKAGKLIIKCVALIDQAIRDIIAIAGQNKADPLDWDEIPESSTRLSMNVVCVDQINQDLGEININLEADRMILERELLRAGKIEQRKNDEFMEIMAKLTGLKEQLEAVKKSTVLEVYALVEKMIGRPNPSLPPSARPQ